MRISIRSGGWVIVLVGALASHACGGGNADSQPAATTPPPAAVTPAATTASSDFGVAECDDYFKKYLTCIDKLAPAAQAQARQVVEQSRTAWKQAAATVEGKAALASTCKAASDAAATAMRAQGCSW